MPIQILLTKMDSLTATRYRIGQYDTFRDKSKCQYFTKQIISAKKQSQLKLLKKIGSSLRILSEKESVAGRDYFVVDYNSAMYLSYFIQ